MTQKIMRIMFLLLFILFTFLFYYTKAYTYLNSDTISFVRTYLITNFGLIIPVMFILILYLFFNIFGFPTMYFSILLGYLYGVSFGFIIAWAGMLSGIIFSFLLSRYLFRELFVRKFGKKEITKQLEEHLEKRHFSTIILTRLFFVIPYNIQNFVYGLTSVKFSIYIIGTAIGIIPITLLNVYLGQLLFQGNLLNAGVTK
ncbi:MAG: hypothetical protein A2355_13810, partial [Spirochaetes bacterium RIFOXYB1_FULL_32_8]